MASGMVPIDMIEDTEISSDEVLVYLAVSIRNGSKLDMVDLSLLARTTREATQTAVLSLLGRGFIEVSGGYVRLGMLGGGTR